MQKRIFYRNLRQPPIDADPEYNNNGQEFDDNYLSGSDDHSSVTTDSEPEDVEDRNHAEPEQENDHEEIYGDDEGDDLLYHGAPLTVRQSMLLILSLVLQHNITLSCLSDILAIINLHCSERNFIKHSLYKFQQFFSFGPDNIIKKQYYCTKCLRALQLINDRCPSCPNIPSSYFIQLSITEQLKEMFMRDNFLNELRSRFDRPANNDFCDIYDGSLYRRWTENGFLSNPHNISFSWCSDGIPVYKSSQVSMW